MINIFKPKYIRKYEKEYEEKEFDILILLDKTNLFSPKYSNYKEVMVHYLGYVNLETGEEINKAGLLAWYGQKSEECIFENRKEERKIYKIRVRKEKKVSHSNYLLLVKILEEIDSNQFLDKIKKDYMKDIIIENDLGEFELYRRGSIFRGKAKWLGKNIEVHFKTDIEHGETADKDLKILRHLFESQEEITEKLKKEVVNKLLEVAEQNNLDIKEKELIKHVGRINSILIKRETINFGIDCKDFFGIHGIEVYTSLELEDAQVHFYRN